jgi:hypothetical protein
MTTTTRKTVVKRETVKEEVAQVASAPTPKKETTVPTAHPLITITHN